MRRLLFGLSFILSLACPSYAVTNAPLFVQPAYAQTTIGNTVTQYQLKFANAVLSNNFVYCWVDNNAANSPTSVADENGAYTLLNSKDTGNSRLHAYYRAATTGARIINVNFSPATSFVHAGCAEFAHIATSAPLDNGGAGAGICSGNATNTAADCTTTINPTQDNDLILFAFTQDDSLATIASFTAGNSFTLGASDNVDSLGFAYWAQPSAAAVGTSTIITISASHSWAGLGSAFKYSAGTGTEPSGMRVTAEANFTQKTADTGPTIQFPCIGGENEILILWNGAAGRSLDGVASANTTGTWAQIGTGVSVNGGSGKTQFWHLPNSTCGSTTTITLTESGGNALDSNVVILGIAGAATCPLDSTVCSKSGTGTCNLTGTDATGAAFSGCALTSSGSGLMIWYIGAATGGGSAISSTSPGLFIGPGTTGVIATSPVGENQGGSSYTSASAQSKTITWTPNAIAIGAWSDYGVSLLATASASSVSGCSSFTLMGVGSCR